VIKITSHNLKTCISQDLKEYTQNEGCIMDMDIGGKKFGSETFQFKRVRLKSVAEHQPLMIQEIITPIQVSKQQTIFWRINQWPSWEIIIMPTPVKNSFWTCKKCPHNNKHVLSRKNLLTPSFEKRRVVELAKRQKQVFDHWLHLSYSEQWENIERNLF